MDKIPRLRRKPKPPAIETCVERADRDAPDNARPDADEHQHLRRQHPLSLPHPHPHPHPQRIPCAGVSALTPAAAHRATAAVAAVKKSSPFRNFKIRASAKRVRASSPADHRSGSPVAALFSHDGVAPLSANHARARPEPSAHPLSRHPRQRHLQSQPKIPGFLTQSSQDLDRKLQEITWAERMRVADALRNQAVHDYRWAHYHDLHQRDMDRYSNMRPWNYNRVRLRVPPGEYDYVNASAIALASPSNPELPPLRYIAMQGPTEPSFDCVWRMVAEQTPSPAVIIQLTTMQENGLVKCHQYFPDCQEDATWTLNESDMWGDGWTAQLTYVSLRDMYDGAIEVRKLLLDVGGDDETRIVWHLLYRRWPDFGVPTLSDMDAFFKLMRLSREYSTPAGPRIVHCSAGVGRTGTFICLEHLIRELDAGALDKDDAPPGTPASPDPIYDTVESLRQQRRGMVQGDVQYRFIYHVMRKLWRERHGLHHDDDGADGEAAEPAAKRLEMADPFTDDHAAAARAPGLPATRAATNLAALR